MCGTVVVIPTQPYSTSIVPFMPITCHETVMYTKNGHWLTSNLDIY